MKNALIVVILTMLCSLSFAAMSEYSFQQTTSTYTEITNPTQIHGPGVDDSMSPVINIGFDFMYDEIIYSTFRANTNGFITLNPTSTASLSNLLATQTLIMGGLWDDLMTNTDGNVSSELSGTSPNQVLTIQFKNIKWYYSVAPVNLINFQIKLFQGTNKIEFVYGTMGDAPGTSATASIGLSGAVAGNYLSITPASPTATYSSTVAFAGINGTHVPFLTGNKYVFTPPVPAQNDLAATAINGNTTPSVGNPTNYTVTVYNRGSNQQNTYTVQLINAANTVLASTPGTTIAAGQTLQIQVSWTPTVEGPAALRGKVILAGDENPANDITAPLNISVMPPGVIVVTVGAGDQTALMPINMYYRNSLNQTLYFPTELGLYGNITAITLYNFFLTNLPNKPTKIWMGTTPQTDLSAGWISSTQMTLVFDGNVNYPSGNNEVLIPLQTIFPFTGGNLVVMFNRPMDAGYFSSSDLFRAQTVGTNRARNVWSDTVVYDPANPGAVGTITGQFAKTSFHMTPLGNDPMFSVTPASKDYGTVLMDTTHNQTFTVMNVGGGTLTINSISIAGSPFFTLQNLPTLPASLATGQSITFVGRYNPTTAGAHTGTITITDNLRLPRTVALTGNCIDTTVNTLPYVQLFDGVTAPALPLDWSALISPGGTSPAVVTIASAPYSAPNCVRIYNGSPVSPNTILVGPPLAQTIPVNTTRMKLWVKGVAATYTLSIGVMTDPLNAATFTQIQSVTTPTVWTEYIIPLNGYTGTGRYIAIKHGNIAAGQTIYVDNVTIELIAANDLGVSALTGNMTPTAGAPSTYTASVLNWGTNPQSTYTVKLFNSTGTELATSDGTAINPGQTVQIPIQWTPAAAGAMVIYARVFLVGDQNTANDQSQNLSILVNPAGVFSFTIGTGTQTARMPIDMFYRNSLYQTLYYPAEMGNFMGQITGIQIYNNFLTNLPNKPTKVWIGTTTQANLSAGFIPSTQLTLVFDGNINYPSGQNTITIPFIQPYLYLNGENLVMLFNRPMDAGYFSSSDLFKSQTVGTNRARNIFSDTVVYDPANPGTVGAVTGIFPMTTFMVIPGGVGHVNGTVLGAGDQPLAGVAVSITQTGATATTNAAGQYQFQNVLPGNYTISFSKYGYVTLTQNFVLEEDETEIINVTMQPMASVSVQGMILASDTGAGLPGAAIYLVGYANYTANSTATGAFTIPNVYANQAYAYTILCPGYTSATGTINVGATNHTMGSITLNEVAYAPHTVLAAINDINTLVNVTWQQPDPNAIEVTESFESATFPPTDWTRTITNTGPINASGVFPSWCRFGAITVSGQPANPTDGTHQAGLWWSYDHQDEWLITPAFNCPPSAYLRFDSYVFLGSTNGDHYYVKVSADNGSTWTPLWDASTQTGGWNYYASPISIGLAAYGGQQIKIAFHAEDPPANDGLWYVWFMDNIYIGNAVTGIRFRAEELVSHSASGTGQLSSPIATTNPSRRMEIGGVRSEPRLPLANEVRYAQSPSRVLTGYKVWRLLATHETNEASWTLLTPQLITALNLADSGWLTLPNGTYRWAVKAVYTAGVTSVPSFSNVLIKDMITGMISGVVRRQNNSPIVGATVTASGFTATTNNAGAYTIVIPIGTHNVTASATGFVSHTIENVVVTANQTTTVNFILIAGSSNEDDIVPVTATALNGNFPNPFNPETTISYAVKDPSAVSIGIYNVKGQLVRTLVNREHNSGRYSVVFNGKDDAGKNIASGIYFYRMTAGSFVSTQKMILMQ
ncbi:MAG: carboxypeptidase regulatory-like domain-containing protein [Candidatus Cloacimonadaceae bacterium]|nr:carboxypeptidase regulatory-like domain-containing protein [Candidatus Cloacimonadaceae bacterium]